MTDVHEEVEVQKRIEALEGEIAALRRLVGAARPTMLLRLADGNGSKKWLTDWFAEVDALVTEP
jgi:hypothetical protein